MPSLSRPSPKQLLADPLLLLAFGFGAGLAPVAPGTLGTLVAIPIWLVLALLPLIAKLAVVAGFLVAGVWICGRAAGKLQVHDHPGIVWDEITGLLITMLAAPTGILWLVGGVLLFRLFDIAKPWPIRAADRRVGGGVGIMLDDVLAAIYAAALIFVARFLLSALS